MKTKGLYISLISTVLTTLFISTLSFAGSEKSALDDKTNTVMTPKIFDMAKKNIYWKVAHVTGKDAQVVFMNITPKTNPNNEIGMETHPFDQVIFVVEGQAKADLNGNHSTVSAGDMIFIPQGVPHNFINLNMKKPFKIISIYSDTDIPKNATYKQKSDTPKE